MKTLLIIVFLFSAPSTVFGNQDNYSEEQVAEAINSLKDYRESKTFVFRNTSKGMMKYGAITATSGLAIAMAGRGIISIGDKMFLKAVRASYGTATQVAPNVLRYSGKKFFKIVLTGSLINAAGRVAAIAGTLTASLGIGIFAITPSTANASEHTRGLTSILLKRFNKP